MNILPWKHWGYLSFQIDRVLPRTEERKWLPLRNLKAKEEEDRKYKRSRYGGPSNDDGAEDHRSTTQVKQ